MNRLAVDHGEMCGVLLHRELAGDAEKIQRNGHREWNDCKERDAQ